MKEESLRIQLLLLLLLELAGNRSQPRFAKEVRNYLRDTRRLCGVLLSSFLESD